jgi:uncharacterized protein
MKIEIYKDTNNEWRWRLVARNGNTVAVSGEGYKRKASMMLALRRIGQQFSQSEIVTVGG